MKSMRGPDGLQDYVKMVLKAYHVPGHRASVYEYTHDTGYPGLCIRSTYVTLDHIDKSMEKKTLETLMAIGFEEI